MQMGNLRVSGKCKVRPQWPLRLVGGIGFRFGLISSPEKEQALFSIKFISLNERTNARQR